MRFIIIGAGAVGGVIAGKLLQNGDEVCLVARGAQYEALKAKGLRLEGYEQPAVTLNIPVVTHPGEIDFRAGDVVLIAVKTQDFAQVIIDLAGVAPSNTPIFCAQNGVWSERFALRVFPNVYGVATLVPSYYLEPGVVGSRATPLPGILDVGRFPSGVDAVAEEVAAHLSGAGFSSLATPDIMRWKYAKLLRTLSFPIEVVCGKAARTDVIGTRARAEGEACLQAAGIDYASNEEDLARRGDLITPHPIAGHAAGGTSTWQSVMRGSPTVESIYLNGEVVELGHTYGVPTPINTALQWFATAIARAHIAPGSIPEDTFLKAAEAPELYGLGSVGLI